MRTLVDERLRDETRLYAYRFACEDCAHATKVDEGGASRAPSSSRTTSTAPDVRLRCSLGYPPGPRGNAIEESHLTLCKAFELE